MLGRKIKGEVGNVVRARDAAIKVRQKTLLHEHKNKAKVNAFLDRRFGEYDQVSGVCKGCFLGVLVVNCCLFVVCCCLLLFVVVLLLPPIFWFIH